MQSIFPAKVGSKSFPVSQVATPRLTIPFPTIHYFRRYHKQTDQGGTPPSSLYYKEEFVVLDTGENQGGANISCALDHI